MLSSTTAVGSRTFLGGPHPRLSFKRGEQAWCGTPGRAAEAQPAAEFFCSVVDACTVVEHGEVEHVVGDVAAQAAYDLPHEAFASAVHADEPRADPHVVGDGEDPLIVGRPALLPHTLLRRPPGLRRGTVACRGGSGGLAAVGTAGSAAVCSRAATCGDTRTPLAVGGTEPRSRNL